MKKFLPYILILVAMFGLFSLTNKVNAQVEGPPQGTCKFYGSNGAIEILRTSEENCYTKEYISWTPESVTQTNADQAAQNGTRTAFEEEIQENTTCKITKLLPGCLVVGAYYVFYVIPAFVLAKVAYFFNVLTFTTLNGDLFKQDFVPKAWGVVRDLSNIFFLLILLYVAIKVILDMGGHGVKETIARVVIIALLINFSMFFTQIVIDTSNVLALVFYNKLNVNTVAGDKPRPYDSVKGEKDIAGGMVAAFDPTTPLKPDFFNETKKIYFNGQDTGKTETGVPAGTMIALILMSGLIMCFAIYALVVSGLSFVGRLIELWVLIIFSPFAFMSSTIPELEGIKYLGWKAWFQRLIDVAFMAPIFMFFLYFIFLLISSNVFTAIIPKPSGIGNATDAIKMLLGVMLPMLLILQLLLKATEFAKKGSGKFGEVVMTGAKLVGGLALGAATGGAALVASNTLGRVARNAANNEEVKARAAAGDKGAQRRLALANSFAKSSFDLRQTGLGKFAAKQTGMDFNKGFGVVGLSTDQLKGGRRERDKEVAKKFDETRKTYMMSDAHARKQDEKHRAWEARKTAYEKDRDQTKKDVEKNGGKFTKEDEEKYKEKYEQVVGKIGPEVKSSKKVNEERQQAYALSLENPARKIEDGKAIKKGLADYRKDFASSFGSGFKDPRLIGLALAGAIPTGGASLLLPAIGGLSHAIKDLVKAEAKQYNVFWSGEHEDTVEAVRKGIKPSIEEALHHLNEAAGVKHEEHHEEHPAPATAAAPATPEHNTSSDHSAAGHPTR